MEEKKVSRNEIPTFLDTVKDKNDVLAFLNTLNNKDEILAFLDKVSNKDDTSRKLTENERKGMYAIADLIKDGRAENALRLKEDLRKNKEEFEKRASEINAQYDKKNG